MKGKRLIFIILLTALTLIAASNAFAEVPDAFTLAWEDFKFKNQEMFSIQSPLVPGQFGNKSMTGEE
jgi:hypothetical protein